MKDVHVSTKSEPCQNAKLYVVDRQINNEFFM